MEIPASASWLELHLGCGKVEGTMHTGKVSAG